MGSVKHFRKSSAPVSAPPDQLIFVNAFGSYVQYVVNNSGVLVPPAVMAHGHLISEVTGLQSALDGKADLSHVHPNATTSVAGFMSAADKIKLDASVNYIHPDSGVTPGNYGRLTVNAQGHVTGGTNPTTLVGLGVTEKFVSLNPGSGNPSDTVNAISLGGIVNSSSFYATAATDYPVGSSANGFVNTISSGSTGFFQTYFDNAIQDSFWFRRRNASINYVWEQIASRSWVSTKVAFGTTAGTYVQGNDQRIINGQYALDKWISGTVNATSLNLVTQGGVRKWGGTTLDTPEGFGTVLSFVGQSTTGDGGAFGFWINQLMAGTSGTYYLRQSINDWTVWSPSYQIWTSKQFTATNIANWNTAFGWGNHASGGYALSSALTSGLAGKENSFSKGNLIQGTNVTLSGTLTGRLVGAGDITISATGGGGNVNGSGTVNYVPKFSVFPNNLGDSKIEDTGTMINLRSGVRFNYVSGQRFMEFAGSSTVSAFSFNLPDLSTKFNIVHSGTELQFNRIDSGQSTVFSIQLGTDSLKIHAPTGIAPFTILSTTVVPNLNVDMLDGFHASNFIQTGRNITINGVTQNLSADRTWTVGVVSASFTNANTISGSGFFFGDPTSTNSPISGGYPTIMQIERAPGRLTQFAQDSFGATSRFFLRSQGSGGTWSNWEEGVSTGNIASYLSGYATTSSLGNYVPKTRIITINGVGGDLSTDLHISLGNINGLGDLNDVQLNSPQSDQILQYYNLRWRNMTAPWITGINSGMVTGALGYTPVSNARTITINGNTQNIGDNPVFTVSGGGGGITGSGNNGILPIWTGSGSIGNSDIIDFGSHYQSNKYLYASAGFSCRQVTQSFRTSWTPTLLGSICYQTDGSQGFYGYGNSGWVFLG